MTDPIARLLHHLLWADDRTARSLASLPLPAPDVVARYAHILGAEAVWLERIAGTPATVTPWPELDAAGCAALARRNQSAIRALIPTLSPDALASVIQYTNTKGASFSNTVAEILHHVVMHGMYHRGQVALEVRRLGGMPLATDFIMYVREAATDYFPG